jgi:hypothetical protein
MLITPSSALKLPKYKNLALMMSGNSPSRFNLSGWKIFECSNNPLYEYTKIN